MAAVRRIGSVGFVIPHRAFLATGRCHPPLLSQRSTLNSIGVVATGEAVSRREVGSARRIGTVAVAGTPRGRRGASPIGRYRAHC
jgi:hypothetical protein